MLASGEAGAAAIDSTVLALRPELAASVRVIETWGPFPIQPIVVRAGLAAPAREAIKRALLAIDALDVAPFAVAGFAPVDEAHYEPERELLAARPR
jgi:ABC-type phosphate/phosphonate transport system substrate-binding protein